MKTKTKIISIDGKQGKEIELPKEFDAFVREDIVQKVLEAKKKQQPYAPSPIAGQKSARGKIKHLRHVWKSGYGRGASRVPRKIFSRRGSQFNWEAAEIPSAKGGIRAHPPKVPGMINTKKINKKELAMALASALSATGKEKFVVKKYKNIGKVENLPIVVEDKFAKLKAKEIKTALQKILGEELVEIAVKKKSLNSGRGKRRGRKYKRSAGMLLVIGDKENLKTKLFDVQKVKMLGVKDLAQGGLGRLVVYTENAIKEIAGGKK